MARPDEDCVRAAAERLGAAHRRVDAELPGGVVRGRDDTTTARVAADDERLGLQRRVIELLDRCEEGVEVEVREDHPPIVRRRPNGAVGSPPGVRPQREWRLTHECGTASP